MFRRRIVTLAAVVFAALGAAAFTAPSAEAKVIEGNCIKVPVPTGGGVIGACFKRLPALPI